MMFDSPIDNLHNGLNLDLGKSFTTAGKRMLKYGKDSRAKFSDFVYICITRGKSCYFAAKTVIFSTRVHKNETYTNLAIKLHRAIFFIFYNVSQQNFAVLLVL